MRRLKEEAEARESEVTGPTRLLLFYAPGRAVPWSVPEVGVDKRGKRWALKEKRLTAWQSNVNFEARRAWGNRPVWYGPVGISLWFYLRESRTEQNLPDLTNLAKATEDALQGAVIHNDRRVRASHAEMLFLPRGRPERTWVEVWAFPNAGHVEPVDPGPYAYRPWDEHWGLQSGPG